MKVPDALVHHWRGAIFLPGVRLDELLRRLQDGRETRPIADRLREVTVRSAFTAEDRAFIERAPMLFIATADAQGRPDCSYKGGLPGFVRVLDERTLAIPDYDSLSSSQVLPRLAGLGTDELEAVRTYEDAHRGRKTILNRITQLQSA